MMVDNDDVSLHRLAPRLDNETALIIIAALPETVFGGGRYARPQRRGFADCPYLTYLAGTGHTRPLTDLREPRVSRRGAEPGRLLGESEPMPAQIICPPLEQCHRNRHAERPGHGREVSPEKLFLQSLGSSGDNDFATGKKRRNKIGKCLPRARAGFHHTGLPGRDCRIDPYRHLLLRRPRSIASYCSGERAVMV